MVLLLILKSSRDEYSRVFTCSPPCIRSIVLWTCFVQFLIRSWPQWSCTHHFYRYVFLNQNTSALAHQSRMCARFSGTVFSLSQLVFSHAACDHAHGWLDGSFAFFPSLLISAHLFGLVVQKQCIPLCVLYTHAYARVVDTVHKCHSPCDLLTS